MTRHTHELSNHPTGPLLRSLCLRPSKWLMAAMVMILGTATAPAATIPMAMEELLAYSDEVVHGTVEPQQDVVMYQGKIFTVSTLRVSDSIKGSRTADSTLQIAVPGGEIGPLGMSATNVTTLKPEEEVILFLSTEHRRRIAENSGASTSAMDMSHPVISSPQIVGGFQGKLNVVRTEESRVSEGLRSVQDVTRVVRHVPGRKLEMEDYPTLSDFTAAVSRAAAPDAPVRTSVRLMPGAPAVDIPERDPDASAMRVFDAFAGRGTSTDKSTPPPTRPESQTGTEEVDGPSSQ